MSDQARIEVLRRLVEAFNRQDVDAAVTLFADDGVWEASRRTRDLGETVLGLG